MASVKATEREAIGRCVGEINVSVELKNEDGWLRCRGKYLRLILVKKSCSILAEEVGMAPGIGGRF